MKPERFVYMRRVWLVWLAAPWWLAPALSAQMAETVEEFVVTRGSDTLAIERFTRTPGEISGTLQLVADGIRLSYSAKVTPEGLIPRLEMAVRLANMAPDAAPVQQLVMHFGGDSVRVDTGSGKEERVASETGVLPFINLSFALFEQALVHAGNLGGDSVQIPVFLTTGGRTMPLVIERTGPGTVAATIGGVAQRFQMSESGRIMSGEVAAQNLRITRGTASAGEAAPAPVDYSAPEDAPYRAEQVGFATPAGHTLAGTLTVPIDKDAPFPVVVLIAGSGPQERDSRLPGLAGYQPFREIADVLGRRGIAVLRFDERGVGASTGDFSAATSEDLADDVRAALAFLRARSDIDSARIALAGHSEGGLIAPMVAAADPAVAAVVSMAGPSRTGREILDYQLRRSVTANATLSAAERTAALDKVPAQIEALAVRPWEAFFLGYDPLPAARRLRVPVLLMQGAADIQVTPEQAEELAAAVRAGGNTNVTVRVLPGVNHLFVRDAAPEPTPYPQLPSLRLAPEVLEALASWLGTNLG